MTPLFVSKTLDLHRKAKETQHLLLFPQCKNQNSKLPNLTKWSQRANTSKPILQRYAKHKPTKIPQIYPNIPQSTVLYVAPQRTPLLSPVSDRPLFGASHLGANTFAAGASSRSAVVFCVVCSFNEKGRKLLKDIIPIQISYIWIFLKAPGFYKLIVWCRIRIKYIDCPVLLV